MWPLLLEIVAKALFKALIATILMLLVVGIAIGVYEVMSLTTTTMEDTYGRNDEEGSKEGSEEKD